ncbi:MULTISPECIES: hypothetical protein [Ramlibacter]|uniref:Uncharacterized protein n=1 Tax=Ramlibacter pinisoli TaxID=2682844 RepID=A0A6N8J1E7_9BURK|nr:MULTISPECIES: hypothetical protein [Ramlibacter]MBA2962053.1 hypothetical protein [Ramlibacter sp. CGMCC 1.13660]MVQ31996.1 hypothetical protein [Ramlibacter pinisoli]
MNLQPLRRIAALLLAAPLLAACNGTSGIDGGPTAVAVNPYPAPAETPLWRSGADWLAEVDRAKPSGR